MTFQKRLFDILVGLLLTVVFAPVIAVTAILILILDGRPIFYISERMHSPEKKFELVKFRTMKPSKQNSGVSGGDKTNRITRCGTFLRKSRLDEVPQLWNVLKGEISFVGPRPPLRQYVEKFPDLYEHVLKSRPGITGLASVKFHRHEEYLLENCRDANETDLVYSRSCVPRKAKLDLIYQANSSICYDAKIMFMTVFKKYR